MKGEEKMQKYGFSMKWRTILLVLVLAILISGHKSFSASSHAGKVPDVIKKLVFETSRFTEPIIIEMPAEDRTYFEYVKEHPVDNSLIPQLIYTFGYQNSNKKLLSFLVQNEYATVESLDRIEKGRRYKYHFLLHTNKLKSIIDNPKSPKLIVAYRNLKSVDYTNEYKGSPGGIEIKFYALTFTYTFSQKVADFPNVNIEFKGKAKAYLDPDDGKWKLEDLELNDGGSYEYLKAIEKNYEAFKLQGYSD